MNLLITGHRGYLGRHVRRLCEAAGHAVRGLDSADGYSLADRGDVDLVLRGWLPDAVVHLAAWCRVGESVRRPLVYAHHNVRGTATLLGALEAAKFSGRFVFASTLLARHPESSPYAASKAFCEHLIAAQARAAGFSAVVLRLGNLAGGGDRTPGRLLVEAAGAAADGRPLTLRGDCVRDYVHAEDAAAAFLLSLTAPLGPRETLTLDVGRGEGVRSTAAAAAVFRAAGREAPERGVPRDPWDVPEVVADPEPAARALGWRAARTLGEMAAEAWEACR